MKYIIILCVLLSVSCNKEPEKLQPGFNVATGPQLTQKGAMQRTIRISVDERFSESEVQVSLALTPFGTFSNGDSMHTVPLHNGVVNETITVSREGTVYLDVSVKGQTRTIPLSFSFAKGIDTLSMTVITDSVAADGYTYAQIGIRANDTNLLQEMKSIALRTDRGTFANGSTAYSQNIGLDGLINVYLKNTGAGRVTVTATVSGTYSKEVSVHFLTAYPDHLFLDPEAATIASLPGTTVDVSARLTRNTGRPSDGQSVYFYDSTATGASVGTFLATTNSGSGGIASTKYSLQDTSYKGYIYLIGKADKGNGGTVRGMNRVLVQ
jgi:hypothetical protein